MEKYFPVVSKLTAKAKGCSITSIPSTEGSVAYALGGHTGPSTSSKLSDDKGSVSWRTDDDDVDIHVPDRTYSMQNRSSSSVITSTLLATLSDVSNPITHSNVGDRTDHIVAFATGHQVTEKRGNQRLYLVDREEKLQIQRENSKSSGHAAILKGAKIYIDGYLESTTDIEIKRLVLQAGGEVLGTGSQCTHIVTSRSLSASKTHRLLTQITRNKPYVVRPEWVLDSIAIGRRRPERSYAIIKNTSTLEHFLKT